MVAWPLLPWTTSSTAVFTSPLLSLARQKRAACDQVQGAGYSESEVETSVTALKLETSVTALELETDASPLKLETDTTPLELKTETDVSLELSKQEQYSTK
jgi:hypothetical protein